MHRRKLGETGFEVAPLAFGGNVFGWTADEARSFQLLDAFVDAGFNLVDTADSYSRWVTGHPGGESETIIGRWIARRGRHDDVIIATKVGSDMGQGHKVLRKDYILQAAEASLRRLQVDCIDLYQSHWDDENTPFEETLGAYDQLIRQRPRGWRRRSRSARRTVCRTTRRCSRNTTSTIATASRVSCRRSACARTSA